MTDDERTELANAYLDGETTADERALVEGDAELSAEVAALRSARALLADVEPASISVREEHLATALNVWDRIPEAERTGATRDATPTGADRSAAVAAATMTAPARLSDRRRQRPQRWIAGAAAAVLLVFAGGVALQLNTSSDDDSASSAADATQTTDAPADEAGSPAALDVDEAGGDRAAANEERAFPDEELDAAVEADGGDLDTGIDRAAPPIDAGLVVLLNPDDLALFASDALNAPPTPDGPVSTSAPIDPDDLSDGERDLVEATLPRCLDVDIVVGPAVYGEVSVIVGIDRSRNLALAYLVDGCDEVARARLP